eukprot:scaffold103276_cov22-Tisochrysis_lutea.AAC.5
MQEYGGRAGGRARGPAAHGAGFDTDGPADTEDGGHHGFAHSCTSAGGGGAGGPWHRSYDGKPPPAEFQSPEFVTYAGLTLPKPKQDWDYWSSKAMGAVLW